MNYYRRYIGDYQRDTGHLTLAEHGAYTVLLDTYYATGARLPRHLSELCRICRATTKVERAAVQGVAQQFFPADDTGTRRNKRADKELDKAKSAIEKMREAGLKSASIRWPKE